MMKCLLFSIPSVLFTGADALSHSEYNSLKSSVQSAIEQVENNERDDGDTVGALTRLVFHDAGTYDPEVAQSGAHGCVLYPCGEGECARNEVENQGLQEASDFVLEQYEQLNAANAGLSRADFLYLVGNVAVEYSSDGDIGSIGFKTGRTDCVGQVNFPGALPASELGRDEIDRVFNRLGFSREDAMTLIGAHTLGRCELPNSGYVLPWLNHPEKFNNEYFEMIVEENWRGILNQRGNPQYIVDDKFMMLNADLDLAYDLDLGIPGVAAPRVLRSGPLFSLAKEYANDNGSFLRAFKVVYQQLAQKTDDQLSALTGEPVVEEPAVEEPAVEEPEDEDDDQDDDEDADEDQYYYRWAYGAAGGILAIGGVVGLARLRNSRGLADYSEEVSSSDEETIIASEDFASSIPELEEEGEMTVFHI